MFLHNSDNTANNCGEQTPCVPGIQQSLRTFKSSTVPSDEVYKPEEFISKNPPKLNKCEWEAFDKDFFDIDKTSWTSLKKGLLTPEQYVSDLNGMLASFLLSKN